MEWQPLWKEFTGKDYDDTPNKIMNVEDGIRKYAEIIAFWNWEKVKEVLPEEEIRKRLHAAIKRSSNLDEEVSSRLGFPSGIMHQILSESKIYKH